MRTYATHQRAKIEPASARRSLRLQAKLTVGAPDDEYEREADRVAEQVTRGFAPPVSPAPSRVQRACACGGTCDSCREEEEKVRRSPAGSSPVPTEAPGSVHEALRSPGQPLDPATRAYFEPRFGHDFARVRVHTDARASESAGAVRARAYTVGPNLVFAAGQYAPQSDAGRRLLAHELVHVVQQSQGAAGGLVQRACPVERRGLGAQVPTAKCDPGDVLFVHGPRLKFCTDSDQLLDGQDNLFQNWVRQATAATSVELHGHASKEGPSAEYNRNLSCHRAAAMAAKLAAAGVATPVKLVAHGPTGVYGDDLENRNVVLVTKGTTPKPPDPKPVPKEKPKEVPKDEPKKAPEGSNPLDACQVPQKASIQSIVSKALNELDQAITMLGERPLTERVQNALYIILHKDDEATADIILERLKKIRAGLPTAKITCDQAGDIVTRCGGETAAYTNMFTDTIHLCMEDWDQDTTSDDARSHTLIHEGAHAFGGISGANEVYFLTGTCEDSDETAGLSRAGRLEQADSTACVVHHLVRREAEDVKRSKEEASGESLKGILQAGLKGAIPLSGPPKKPRFMVYKVPVVKATNLKRGGGFAYRWRLSDDQGRNYLIRGTESDEPLDTFEFTGETEVYIGAKTRELLAQRKVTQALLECTVRVPDVGKKSVSLTVTFTP